MGCRSKIFVFLLFSFLFFPSAVSAATIYTNSASGNDTSGDGSVGAPYKTFHKAYTSASSGDIIDATGTFTWTDADETGDATTSGYTLAKNLTIQGQGPANTIFQAAASEATANRRVFTISNGFAITFNDLTVRYGYLSSDGGGILINGTATIDSSDISYNRATDGNGGGIIANGALTIRNSTVRHNKAHYNGGGISRGYYSGTNGTPTSADDLHIINSTIAHNQVTQSVAYLEGGGVFF